MIPASSPPSLLPLRCLGAPPPSSSSGIPSLDGMVSPPPSPSPPPAAADQMRAAPAGGRRRKVALAPGHSHLDWMRLTATLPRYRGPTMHTAAEVAAHRRRGDAWTVIRGRVYDVSRYVDFHPGGAAMLLSGAGKVSLVSGWTVSRGGSCRVELGPSCSRA